MLRVKRFHLAKPGENEKTLRQSLVLAACAAEMGRSLPLRGLHKTKQKINKWAGLS